jgi:hypothetical protein
VKELKLPHQAPIRFAKYVISKEENTAVVKVKFDTIPSLPMIVEAAAQSSAALSDTESKMGFLVTLKNIKLLEKLNALEYDIKVSLEHQFEDFRYFSFEVYYNNILVATGVFIVSVT